MRCNLDVLGLVGDVGAETEWFILLDITADDEQQWSQGQLCPADKGLVLAGTLVDPDDLRAEELLEVNSLGNDKGADHDLSSVQDLLNEAVNRLLKLFYLIFNKLLF